MFPIRDRGSRGALESRRTLPARFRYSCILNTLQCNQWNEVISHRRPDYDLFCWLAD